MRLLGFILGVIGTAGIVLYVLQTHDVLSPREGTLDGGVPTVQAAPAFQVNADPEPQAGLRDKPAVNLPVPLTDKGSSDSVARLAPGVPSPLDLPSVDLPIVDEPSVQPAPLPPATGRDSSPRWQAFWGPFNTKASAKGFSEKVSSKTDLDIQPIETRTGSYFAAFPYRSDDERTALKALIEQRTGLVVELRSPALR